MNGVDSYGACAMGSIGGAGLVLGGLAIVASVAPAPGAHAGAAPAGASNTATPNYLSATSPTAGANEFKCSGGGCTMIVKTKTTPYPCTSELIVLSGATTPGLLYQNTYCSVVINGFFEASLGEGSRTCALEAAQTLTVGFSSGVNSAFNGSFPATGTFKPTGYNATTGNITTAVVIVKAGGQLTANPAATGTVKASFQVRFGGAGLNGYCYAPTASGLTPVTSGTVAVRF